MVVMIYKRRETRPGPPHCSSSLLGGWVGKQKRRRLSGRQSQRAPQHDLAAWARSALRFAAELRLAAGFHLSAPLSIHCLRDRFTSGCSAYASLTGLRLRRLTNVCGCLAPVRAPALKSVKRLLAMGHSNGSGAPTAIYLTPAALRPSASCAASSLGNCLWLASTDPARIPSKKGLRARGRNTQQKTVNFP